MHGLLVFLLLALVPIINLYGSQTNDARTCVKMLARQMKKDAHNKTIGIMLAPFVSEQEIATVNDRFDKMRNRLPDIVRRVNRAYALNDFSGAWACVSPEIRQLLANYYRDSARIMQDVAQRATAQQPDFPKQKNYNLIESMIASCNETATMLEDSCKQKSQELESSSECVIL